MLKICRYCQLGIYTKFSFRQLSIYVSHLAPLVATQCPGFHGGFLARKGRTARVLETKFMDLKLHVVTIHSSHSGPLQDIPPQSVNSIISVVKARKLGINLDISFLHPITSKHSQLAFINLSLLHNQFLSLPPF